MAMVSSSSSGSWMVTDCNLDLDPLIELFRIEDEFDEFDEFSLKFAI